MCGSSSFMRSKITALIHVHKKRLWFIFFMCQTACLHALAGPRPLDSPGNFWQCPSLPQFRLGAKRLVTVIFKNLLDNARQYTENERAFVVLKTSGILVGNKGRIVRHAGVFCAASAAPAQAVRHPPAKERGSGQRAFPGPAGLRAFGLSRDCARPMGRYRGGLRAFGLSAFGLLFSACAFLCGLRLLRFPLIWLE